MPPVRHRTAEYCQHHAAWTQRLLEAKPDQCVLFSLFLLSTTFIERDPRHSRIVILYSITLDLSMVEAFNGIALLK